MEQQRLNSDLPLTLDDFIPRHLQRKISTRSSQTPEEKKAIPVTHSNGANTLNFLPCDSPINQYWTDQPRASAENEMQFRPATSAPSEQAWDSEGQKIERHWIRYDGIGPTDKDGMPFASRSSVDKPRDWYRNMFRVLHRRSDSEDSDKDSDDGHRSNNANRSIPISSKSGFNEDVKWNHNESGNLTDTGVPVSWKTRQTLSPAPREHPLSPSSSFNNSHTYLSPPSRHTSLNYSSRDAQKIPNPSSEGKYYTLGSSNNPYHSLNMTPMETPSLKRTTTSKPQQIVHAPDFPYATLPKCSKESLRSHEDTTISMKVQPPQMTSRRELHPSLSPTHEKIKFSLNTEEPIGCQSSASDTLEKLETELRQFTEELERDLVAHRHDLDYIPKQNKEFLLNRPSAKPGGSSDTNPNRTLQLTDHAKKTQITALVKFDFEAQSAKELSLKRGSSVRVLKKVDKNWLLGEQNGQKGVFPESYVTILSPGQPVKSHTPQLSAVALYDFKADSDAELSLRKGQHILITRRVNDSWFEGRVKGSGRLGLLPASYVQVKGETSFTPEKDPKVSRGLNTNSPGQSSPGVTLKETASSIKPSAPSRIQKLPGTLYRALFNFLPNNPDELHLMAGDLVTVTQHCEDGWYIGVCWRTERFGTFPGNYVAPHVTLDTPMTSLKDLSMSYNTLHFNKS
ncbi:vinexin isoform X2 [Bombina bombina]|uniref:vinexin isoform X2 n=1 Tax=Bombina bombina TaxID=8345 RepID=UPI00235B2052|nr:vinexin isoform X2 [Bombina bombina]